MFRSSATRWALGVLVLIAVLGLLRFKPWQRLARRGAATDAGLARQQLSVGFLPVT
ncbi:MAG TPA: hypothetical protein VGB17_15300 [Pyrinomonadaceae bacterium]|jgi:hypothetical protein